MDEVAPLAVEVEAEKQEENAPLGEFLKKFETLMSSEEKLRSAISFMRTSLERPGTPYFKGFWEIRKLSLPLFKEGLAAPLRSSLWDEYVELTREGRRLKSLLDEESAFAIEQIEMAIKSLEVEVEGFHHYAKEVLSKIPDIEMPSSKTLEGKKSYYLDLQRRLNLLNTYASHIHALRKELIKTEMRVRHKNKFFERLSLMGDKIFPVRKELIKEASLSFSTDVNAFVEEHFSEANFSETTARTKVFFYREEIKALQSCAKIITLNTTAFTATREALSQAWDKLKGMEKELKKEFAQTKHKSSENTTEALAKIKGIMDAFNDGKKESDDTLRALDEVSRWMRGIELTHQDVRMLKEQIHEAKSHPEAKKQKEKSLKKQKDQEIEEKRKMAFEGFRERFGALKEKISPSTLEEANKELLQLRSEFAELALSKREKAVLEKDLKDLRDLIEEKKEEAFLNLSDETKAQVDNLKEIYQQRKLRRSEIKAQIEEYRRLIGGSSLDFEKAIEYGDLMTKEKERLEKVDESIREIEEKIDRLRK